MDKSYTLCADMIQNRAHAIFCQLRVVKAQDDVMNAHAAFLHRPEGRSQL